MTLKCTGDELINPHGCTKLPLKIPKTVNLVDKNYNTPSEIVQQEAWAYDLTNEDVNIHVIELVPDDTYEVV